MVLKPVPVREIFTSLKQRISSEAHEASEGQTSGQTTLSGDEGQKTSSELLACPSGASRKTPHHCLDIGLPALPCSLVSCWLLHPLSSRALDKRVSMKRIGWPHLELEVPETQVTKQAGQHCRR
ncbi:hypothetical protein CLAIMM_05641 [Cladophialophora immunda]|nr:hypothetical protein CLAIMM_05641 [Cladophialophora immunda]